MGSADPPKKYAEVRDAFDSSAAAEKYAIRKNRVSPRNQREIDAILRCMEHLAGNAGLSCIDIPCGAFRLADILLPRDFATTASDYSSAMLEQAKRYASSRYPEKEVSYSQQDISETGFSDSSFDLVICNRLFHHYDDAELRIKILSELNRICRQLVIVSFFDADSASNWIRRLRILISGHPQRDRFAIPRIQFVKEAREAGLQIVAFEATRRGISPQTYVALKPGQSA